MLRAGDGHIRRDGHETREQRAGVRHRAVLGVWRWVCGRKQGPHGTLLGLSVPKDTEPAWISFRSWAADASKSAPVHWPPLSGDPDRPQPTAEMPRAFLTRPTSVQAGRRTSPSRALNHPRAPARVGSPGEGLRIGLTDPNNQNLSWPIGAHRAAPPGPCSSPR